MCPIPRGALYEAETPPVSVMMIYMHYSLQVEDPLNLIRVILAEGWNMIRFPPHESGLPQSLRCAMLRDKTLIY